MTDRPRTPEDFDNWFQATGDPWGYRDDGVQNRLRDTERVLEHRYGRNFGGTFVELGAFDGTFSARLGAGFKSARLLVNDISQVALQRARAAVETVPGLAARTRYLLKDSVAIDADDFRNDVGDAVAPVVLLLECLYYLKPEERKRCLRNLASMLPRSDILISGPISGPPYLDEPELVGAMQALGYRLVSLRVLNLRRGNRLPSIARLADHIGSLRRQIANQVLYVFTPQHRNSCPAHS